MSKLHLVFGGRVKDPRTLEFQDPSKLDVVGIFPAESAIVRLIGAVLLEANDEWAIQHRYMQVEVMAELSPPLIEIEGEVTPEPNTQFTPKAA